MLILTGVLLVMDAGITLAWQEPLSALYARLKQNQLSGQLNDLDRRPASAAEMRALRSLADTRQRVAFLARRLRARSRPGQPLGRIHIARIGASFVVVEGTDDTTLHKGPGHYPATPLPGMDGTVAIAGHRTTYLAPFRHADALHPGDSIGLDLPYGRFSYVVEKTKIVLPTDVGVIRSVGYPRLVLSACHPLYSASHRIIVFARLLEFRPRGLALIGAATSGPQAPALPAVVPVPVPAGPPPLGPPPRRLAPAGRG